MKIGGFASVRNAFFSGLILLAPLAVTLWVFTKLVAGIGGTFKPYFFFFVPERWAQHEGLQFVWNVLATVIVCLLITGLGILSRLVLGRYFGGVAERVIQGIPGVNTVYNTVKQIVDTFSTQNRNIFSQVVLLQFPREGMWVIGFLTNKAQGEPQARTSEELWTVFVPTTPNPTSGFLVMVPKHELVELNMTVGEGMKLIISGGAVTPPWPPAPRAQAPASELKVEG